MAPGSPAEVAPRPCIEGEGGIYHIAPRYPAQSAVDGLIRQVEPGHDEFISELYAEEVARILEGWSTALRRHPADFSPILGVLSAGLRASPLQGDPEEQLQSEGTLQVWRTRFPTQLILGREAFVKELASLFPTNWRLRTAEFEVAGIDVKQQSPLVFSTRIRYDLVGSRSEGDCEERIGSWILEWRRTENLVVQSWQAVEETHSRSESRIFEDITVWSLGENASYRQQLLRGTDYWRTVLDVACGIDVYGNNGIACGDIDNDGFDDIYICQPAGLPNRLYRNHGNGRFEDVTEWAGVGILDDTASALFADIDNDGFQDLITVRTSGPLLFRNDGHGRFRSQRDAFRFAKAPQGTFTGAALGDYDRDGWLDVYFCLYSYYEGLDQYRYPVPYYDARNGPPNFLLRNNRDGTFTDVTAAAGLNQNNDHFSFACGWCDYNGDGWPDVYVVNDFGRKNLYRNNGNGTFTDVAEEAGVLDIGPGMSCCWIDYDNDGRQDLYVCDMWEPAGTRVSSQPAFMTKRPQTVRALYRRHAKGNALFQNRGEGSFEEHSAAAEVEKAGWSWSCAAWDFDHDGHSDIYVTNGMISGSIRSDLQGFFWRQVVSQSPLRAVSSSRYEEGWNAINELIRSDGTWNGYQRNVFFRNNSDGTFAHVSGVTGLDFPDDSRAFALADFDHDGSLELVLKNRTAPQVRILRNVMKGRGNSISFRLRGHESNRDAIGAVVTVETRAGRQTRFLEAGSGFLSQHSKDLFFGLGQSTATVRVTVRWPSGLVQTFDLLPANHRFELTEGLKELRAEPFGSQVTIAAKPPVEQRPEPLPICCETWLVDPLSFPDFALRDLEGRLYALSRLRGQYVLLNFWSLKSPGCKSQLEQFQLVYPRWQRGPLQLLAINADGPAAAAFVREYASKRTLSFPLLIASEEMLGIWNVLYRYLFDRRRNLGVPSSFLVDMNGDLVKVYQGPVNPAGVELDLGRIPHDEAERERRALPFPGKFYAGSFHRNLFTYGVAFFRAGYIDESIAWFEKVVRKNPEYASAHYNLGTMYLSKGLLSQAEEHLRQATRLRPEDSSAWNNLGMVAAQEHRTQEAAWCFERALQRNPEHVIALENLGKVYQETGRYGDARKSLERALSIDPQNPEVNYDLGMLFAHQDDTDHARVYLFKAIELRPNYRDALNNLGVLNLRTGNFSDAQLFLERCIRLAPNFEVAYLNLAKAFKAMGNRERARAALRQLLAVHPGDPAAIQALEQLDR